MIIIVDGLIPSFFQLTPVSKQYFLLQLKNLNHPVNYTVKTRDLEPTFSQVSLNRFLHKW